MPATRLTVEVDKEKRLVSEDKMVVLAYNFGMILAANAPEDRRLSCYVHPILGLDGEVISGDFEKDRHHHRGLFCAWPTMTVRHHCVGLWDLKGIQAIFEKWFGWDEGPVGALFGARNGGYAGAEPVGQEEFWFRMWRATHTGRAIDAELTFSADITTFELSGAPGKGYSGFCLRVRDLAGKTVTKPNGHTVASSDETLPWVHLSGRFGGPSKVSTAATFVEPEHRGFPNSWCLRHHEFIGVNRPGVEPTTPEPHKPVTLEYRSW